MEYRETIPNTKIQGKVDDQAKSKTVHRVEMMKFNWLRMNTIPMQMQCNAVQVVKITPSDVPIMSHASFVLSFIIANVYQLRLPIMSTAQRTLLKVLWNRSLLIV